MHAQGPDWGKHYRTRTYFAHDFIVGKHLPTKSYDNISYNVAGYRKRTPAHRVFEDCEPLFPENSLEHYTFLRSARRLLGFIQGGRRMDRKVHTVCSRAPRRGSSNEVLRAKGDTVAMVVVNQERYSRSNTAIIETSQSHMRNVIVTGTNPSFPLDLNSPQDAV